MKRFWIFAMLLVLVACTPTPSAAPTAPPTATVELTVDPPTITPSATVPSTATTEPTTSPDTPTATTEPTAIPPTATPPISPPATPTAPVSPLGTPTTILLPNTGTPHVTALQDDGPPLDSPESFLQWVALGGAPLIGALIALLARKSKWFQLLPSEQKRWVSFGLGAGIPAISSLLLFYVPSAIWEALRPVWTIVVAAVLGYLGKEGVYLAWIKPQEREWIIEE